MNFFPTQSLQPYESLFRAFMSANPAKKRVTFYPTVVVHEFDAQPTTKEEKSELHYTKDELKLSNLEVRAMCSLSNQLNQKVHTTPEQEDRSNCVLAIEEADDFLRGLEYYIYPQRFQNKVVARKALLKYQAHLASKFPNITQEEKANAMRKASEKLSAWSHLVAKETARLDSLRAYDAEYLIPVNDTPVELSPLPTLAAKRKGSFREVRRVTPDDVPPRSFSRARAA